MSRKFYPSTWKKRRLMKREFWHIWTIPIALNVLGLIGLIAALVGNDGWDILSWISLGIPLVVTAWYLTKPRPSRPRPAGSPGRRA